eukprot:350528-Chlamydomonas_euryale.AAC.5
MALPLAAALQAVTVAPSLWLVACAVLLACAVSATSCWRGVSCMDRHTDTPTCGYTGTRAREGMLCHGKKLRRGPPAWEANLGGQGGCAAAGDPSSACHWQANPKAHAVSLTNGCASFC